MRAQATFALLIAALLLVVPAQAGTITDFTGPYAPGNWTFTNTPSGTSGSLNTSGAPASITLISGNSGVAGNTDLLISALGTGTWSFSWSYSTADWDWGWDPAYYGLNGSYTALHGSGSANLSIAAGDVIGYRIGTSDGSFGSGSLTIRDFAAPDDTAVPEPSTLSLLALGAAGLLVYRLRQRPVR